MARNTRATKCPLKLSSAHIRYAESSCSFNVPVVWCERDESAQQLYQAVGGSAGTDGTGFLDLKDILIQISPQLSLTGSCEHAGARISYLY